MNEVMRYVIGCADKGNLSDFLKKCDKDRKYVYIGSCGIDLIIENGEVVRVMFEGRELTLVEV